MPRKSRKLIPPRVVKNWPRKAVAQKRYEKFVEPFLGHLKSMARRRSRGDKRLADEMLSEAILEIISAVGTQRIKKPKHFVLRVARKAMIFVGRVEDRQKKLHRFRPLEAFLLIVDKRRKTPVMYRAELLKVVETLLAKAKVKPRIQKTFIYHTGLLEDGKPKEYSETAKHCKIPIMTAITRVRRVRKKLRQMLGIEK